jgi:starch synthase (maltosyl-transferring)
MDPYNVQSGWVRIPVEELDIPPGESFEIVDLIDQARYTWRGEWNYVELNPQVLPGHVFRVEWPQTPAGEGQATEIFL